MRFSSKMEEAHQLYNLTRPQGKNNLEWDLNDWNWDGDLFIARPASVRPNFRGQQFVPAPAAAVNSLNSSSSCSDDLNPEPEIERVPTQDFSLKRRVVVVDDDDDDDAEAGPLSLKLGSHPSSDGTSPNHAVCQVDGCSFDLSNAKPYHRRHKVCGIHSKATAAMVGKVMQRFCQQCSRFHTLEVFDDAKKSCRRRLEGHNKRRRKTQPEPVVSVESINVEQASKNAILVATVLQMFSAMHNSNRSELRMGPDVVGNLMKSIASQSGSQGVVDLFGQLNNYQKSVNGGLSVGNVVNHPTLPSSSPSPPRPIDQHYGVPPSEMPQEMSHKQNSGNRNTEAALSEKPELMFSKASPPAHPVGQTKLNNFDLNDTYIDLDDGAEVLERSPATAWAQQNSQQSSPPQNSGSSCTASDQSPPSTSSGEDQGRTGRISFKLFEKGPSDIPLPVRGQVLDWLNHSPVEMESFIRPGCVILTLYVRLAEPVWEKLSLNLCSSLSRLMDVTDDSFWRSGWVYTRVQDQVSFCYNGKTVANSSLPSETSYSSRILSVNPIAVSMSELANFQIKGYNLSSPTKRIICAIEGKYLAQEDHRDVITDNALVECVNLSCSIPSVTGRGFIEVEDDDLSSSFFPFIVAEKDVCSDIRKLECILDNEVNSNGEAKRQAMDFIHEMGWLMRRYQLNTRPRHQNPNTILFSFKRFRFLMEFSMDRDWCAVVRKLLDVFLEGIVSQGEQISLDVALSEMDLLHRAVRRNSRPLVELLLHYAPAKNSTSEDGREFLFRPDKKAPAGITPLHIAAGTDGSESVLDALTDDPGKVGLVAWKNARDSTGSSPEDYARLRGHYSYIHLIQRKHSRMRASTEGSVVVEIAAKQHEGTSSFDIASRNTTSNCNMCERKLSYGVARGLHIYRPMMLSIVGVAAVCVCVALLFRGSPDVECLLKPFRWESLDFGTI